MARGWKLAIGMAVVLGWVAGAEAMYTPNPAGRWAQGRFFLAGDLQYNVEKDLDGGGELEDQIGVFVRPAYSVADNIMVYGRLGFQDAKGVDAGFAAGFGVQGAYVFPRAREWAVGGAFDFVYWDTEFGDTGLTYIEYQFSPAVSYNVPQIPALTPYAGFMVDFLGSDFDEDKPFGVLFGTNYDPTDQFRLDAQFRAISETGFYFSAGYMF